jgi:hypothetical protein
VIYGPAIAQIDGLASLAERPPDSGRFVSHLLTIVVVRFVARDPSALGRGWPETSLRDFVAWPIAFVGRILIVFIA